MKYDAQIGNLIYRGISYAELISLPINSGTLVRRTIGEWMMAKDCVELTHILTSIPPTPPSPSLPPSTSYSSDIPYPSSSDIYIDSSVNRSAHYSSNDYVDEEEEYEEDYVEEDYDDEDYEDDDYQEDDYDDDYEEDYDDEDDEDVTVTPPASPRYPVNQFQPDRPASFPQNGYAEERIFIPSAAYFKCKQKRKAAIIGVCTLGLAGLALMGVVNTWRSNIFQGTSFSSNAGIAFILKCLSFCILTMMVAVPYFIYSVFALIYYSIRLSSLKR